MFFFDMDTDFCFSDKRSYFPEIPETDPAAAASVFPDHIPAFDMLMTAHIKQSFQISAFKAADQIASKPSEQVFHKQPHLSPTLIDDGNNMSTDTDFIFIKIDNIQICTLNQQSLFFKQKNHFLTAVSENFSVIQYFYGFVTENIYVRHILFKFFR